MPVTLTGGSWDQAPNEIDEILGETVTLVWQAGDLTGCTAPASANDYHGALDVSVDGTLLEDATHTFSGIGLSTLTNSYTQWLHHGDLYTSGSFTTTVPLMAYFPEPDRQRITPSLRR